VNDLYEDLRDGHNLISLLEVLSGDTLVSFEVKSSGSSLLYIHLLCLLTLCVLTAGGFFDVFHNL